MFLEVRQHVALMEDVIKAKIRWRIQLVGGEFHIIRKEAFLFGCIKKFPRHIQIFS